MKTLVTGAFGQLGTDLLKTLPSHAVGMTRQQLDITDPESVTDCLQQHRPEVVINAAAYNHVDRAESEPDVAFSVNALGPRNLALACESIGATLVHVSTDYVFGRDELRLVPFFESEPAAPQSAYGISKLAGENFVQSCCRRSIVVRTCGVYGHAAREGAGKGNFVETMIRLGSELDRLRVVNDQCCTPTSSSDLSRAILRLIDSSEYGLFHFANSGATTWFEFASQIFTDLQMNVDMEPISSAEYPTQAPRPRFSVLDCTRYEVATGQLIDDWKIALRRYLKERSEALSQIKEPTSESRCR